MFHFVLKPAALAFGLGALAPLTASAQATLLGRVQDAATGRGVPGATVAVPTLQLATMTDADGIFRLTAPAVGPVTLRISSVGYAPLEVAATAADLAPALVIRLTGIAIPLAEAQVVATRANAQTATAYQTLDERVLKDRNFGQDIPYLLDQTPSVVTTSDAGTGIGYTGLRIRGTDPTRVNVTLNGVPVNEAESHSVFFVDLPDLASSTQSIQVQRGVGTSTNGAGAFGGSVNVETSAPRPTAYADLTNAAGSYGTWRTTVAAGTGLLGADSTKGHFALDARASRVQSEGYVDRGFSRLRSLYLAGTYLTGKTLVRALLITGQERTGQAWYGTPQDSVKKGLRTYNPAGFDYVEYAGNQRPTPYGNQTDNYQQDYYQLLISHQVSPALTLSATPFWTRGGGYYEEYKVGEKFAKYGLTPGLLIQDGDTITRTDVVRRRWLQTNLFGGTWAATLAPTGARWNLTLGGAAVGYRGHHHGDVIWARYAAQSENDQRYYDERTRKTDVNAYARATWRPTDRLTAYVDGQYRTVRYALMAPKEDYGARVPQAFNFNFFNPKAGLTFDVAAGLAAYASVAVAHREPTRTAYTDTPPSRQPRAEQLLDYEAGLRRTTGHWQWGLNGYWMQYRDQLVLSGRLDDVGNAIPTNVKDSYRRGIELTTAASFWDDRLSASGNLTLSQNRIRQYLDYVSYYDANGDFVREEATAYAQTTIAYSPSVIGAATVEAEVVRGLRVALLGKHVGRQYLDNTATATRSLDPYTVVDARLRYLRPTRFLGLREVEAALLVNNVLSEKYASNGYTYAYHYNATATDPGTRGDYPFLFSQAPINFLATLSLRW